MCYMTSWIIAFLSRRQCRELPTHSYISLKITRKLCTQGKEIAEMLVNWQEDCTVNVEFFKQKLEKT